MLYNSQALIDAMLREQHDLVTAARYRTFFLGMHHDLPDTGRVNPAIALDLPGRVASLVARTARLLTARPRPATAGVDCSPSPC